MLRASKSVSDPTSGRGFVWRLTGPGTRHVGDSSPSNAFKEVIWARDKPKAVAVRDRAPPRAGWTQVA